MRLLIAIFLACFTVLGISQDATEMTLQEAIDYGIKNHISIKNALVDIEDAQQLINETKAAGLPQVNAGISYNYFLKVPESLVPAEFFGGAPGEFAKLAFGTKNNLTGSIEASSLVYDGSYNVGLRAARKFKEYVNQALSVEEQTVKNNIIRAYLSTFIIEEGKKTLTKNIGNIQAILVETKAYYQNGLVEQLDIDRLELSLANLQAEYETLSRQSELAYNGLKFSMGFPISEPLKTKDTMENLVADAKEVNLTMDINHTLRPEYQLLQMGEALNEMDVERYRAGYLPSLAVFISAQESLQGDNIFKEGGANWIPTAVAGFQINIPIFDSFQKRAKIERANIALVKMQNNKRMLKEAIDLEIINARISYQIALSRLDAQEKNIKLAEKIYNTTKIKYKEGVGSSLEITQAEQSLYQTQGNYNVALYELLVAKANLDIAIGN